MTPDGLAALFEWTACVLYRRRWTIVRVTLPIVVLVFLLPVSLLPGFLTPHGDRALEGPSAQASGFEPLQVEEFDGTRSRILGERLEAARSALLEFRERTGDTSLTERGQGLLADRAVAEAARASLEMDRRAVRGRLRHLDRELAVQPSRMTVAGREVQTEALRNLEQRVFLLEAQRAELLTGYVRASHRVHDIDEQIAAARRILDSRVAASFEEHAGDVDRSNQALRFDRGLARTELAALRTKRAAIDARLVELDRRVGELAAQATELAGLEKTVDLAERKLLAHLDWQEALRLANGLPRRPQQFLDPAVTSPVRWPGGPSRTASTMVLLAGLLLGLVSGVFKALLDEGFDSKVNSRWDVERLAGVEVLAIVTPEGVTPERVTPERVSPERVSPK